MTVEAWHRWLLWKKAQASSELWEAWRGGVEMKLTADQQALYTWAMLAEEY